MLEDAADLEEGASVTVWVERSQEVVSVTDEELELVRRGQLDERSIGMPGCGGCSPPRE